MEHSGSPLAYERAEKREVARRDLCARLLLADGRLFDVRLIDLSYNGCKISGIGTQLQRGAPVAVELPGLTEFSIGRVAWSNADELGVQFEAPLFEPIFRYLKDKLFGFDEAA